MTLDQALFNWLQIYYVLEQRPHDEAAQETCQFFWTILTEDHGVQTVEVDQHDDMYIVRLQQKGVELEKKFPVQAVQQLWFDLEENQAGQHQD